MLTRLCRRSLPARWRPRIFELVIIPKLGKMLREMYAVELSAHQIIVSRGDAAAATKSLADKEESL
jgi:hypothetical protein